MCGALPAQTVIDPALLAAQTVVRGVVTRAGQPVTVGYARLHDGSGEFVAEVPLNSNGEFRFFARPADWTIKVLVSGASLEKQVTAEAGDNAPVEFTL